MEKSNYKMLVFALLFAGIILSLQFASAAQSAVNLGTAGNFAILSQSGISTTGTTSIVGNIGVSPISSTAVTGFGLVADSSNTFSTSSLVVGNVYAADYSSPTPSVMTSAIGDMQTAYNDAAARNLPDSIDYNGGNLGSTTFAPGLYRWNSDLTLFGDITLAGNSTDVWIFQTSGTLWVKSKIILSGGAQAKNVFWQTTGTTLLGYSSQSSGNFLSKSEIVFKNGATLNGRALAQTAVTLDSNNIVSPNKNDFQAPITIATNPGNSWTNSDYNVTLNATSFNNTYVDHISYSLNGVSGQIDGNYGIIPINISANNTLTFYAFDSFSHSEGLNTIYPLLDEVAPNITSFNLSSSSVNVGETITASCIATDNVDSNVSINVTTIDTSVAGTFAANCTATDFVGNIALASLNYTVTTPTPTSTSNGGGGGGGGSQCLTNWTCSDWSVCSNNIQTRTCNRIRSYCYAGAQPALNQTCTTPVIFAVNNTTNTLTNNSATATGNGDSGITGAVTGSVGTGKGLGATGWAILVLIGVGIYGFIALLIKPMTYSVKAVN